MKYKIGDRVKIKRDNSYSFWFSKVLEENNYTFTIVGDAKELAGETFYNEPTYIIKELQELPGDGQQWIREGYIEELYEESFSNTINSRFEILDL